MGVGCMRPHFIKTTVRLLALLLLFAGNASAQSVAGIGVTPAASVTVTAHKSSEIQLSADNALAAVGQSSKLKAKASQLPDNAAAPNLKLSFRINGQMIGQQTTTADGTATLDFTVPESLKPGTHAFEVILNVLGSQLKQATGQLMVVKAQTKMRGVQITQNPPNPVPVDGKNTLAIFGYLERDGQQGVAGRSVRITLGSRQLTAVTQASGFFSIGVPIDAKDLGKSLPLGISFNGDDSYLAYALPTVTQQIRPAANHIYYDLPEWPTSYDPELKLGNKIAVLVRVRDSATNKPVQGVSIRLRATGAIYHQEIPNMGSGVTNTAGLATVQYLHNTSVRPDLYEMSILFDNLGVLAGGYTYLDPNHVRDNFRVVKTDVTVSVTAPGTVKAGDKATIDVQFRRSVDNQPAQGFLRIYHLQGAVSKEVLATNYPTSGGSFTFDIPTNIGTGKQTFRVAATQPPESGYHTAEKNVEIALVPADTSHPPPAGGLATTPLMSESTRRP